MINGHFLRVFSKQAVQCYCTVPLYSTRLFEILKPMLTKFIVFFYLSLFRDIVFGPPGRSKGALLFLLGNLLVWGYPVYFFYVSAIYSEFCANLADAVVATFAVMVYPQRSNAGRSRFFRRRPSKAVSNFSNSSV